MSVDELFAAVMSKGAVVCEELIVQAKEMAVLHQGSVNTCRIPTVRVGDEVIVFHPCLRMGSGNAVVDNASSGGIIAPIDATTGIVVMRGEEEKHNSYTGLVRWSVVGNLSVKIFYQRSNTLYSSYLDLTDNNLRRVILFCLLSEPYVCYHLFLRDA